MKYDYIIEIRPILEKILLKRKITDLKKELRFRKTPKVPHITLIYNFTPKIQNYKLAELVKDTASRYKELRFEYRGWDLEEKSKGHVFGFKIKPSRELKEFRYELYQKIKNHIIEDPRTRGFNRLYEDNFWFHSSIAIHLDEEKAKKTDKLINNKNTFLDKLSDYLKGKNTKHIGHLRTPLFFPSEVARIPIIRSSKITYEYDKFTNKVLRRSQALSKNYTQFSLASYRKKENLEAISRDARNSNVQTWFFSDTHFDHSNIIRYCARPFADVREMNEILVNNWNAIVKKQDKMYFLGDLATSGRGSKPKDYWLNKLSGEIVHIVGNHDKDKENTKFSETVDYKGHRFLLIHDPNDKPKEWKDWVIHGHTHNNNLGKYPLINWEQKTINVAVELIKYRPINFDKIIELIENKKEHNIITLDYE